MKQAKILFALVILILVCVILVAAAWMTKGMSITISEREIVERIQEKFPLEKTHLMVFQVRYSDPVLEFLDGENKLRIGLTATPELAINGKEYSGSAIVTGRFRYVPEDGDVFLGDLSVESLQIGNTRGLGPKLSAALALVLEDIYSKRPLYRLKDHSLKEATAKMLVRKIEIKDKNVVIHQGFF
jgi:Protein of unknown function (DUF1439)